MSVLTRGANSPSAAIIWKNGYLSIYFIVNICWKNYVKIVRQTFLTSIRISLHIWQVSKRHFVNIKSGA